MADVSIASTGKTTFRQYEFIAFSIVAFVGKSALLIRLPYRPIEKNALYTVLLLTAFYCYFRFRSRITPPLLVMVCLGAAVAVDVLGNVLKFYGREFAGVQYDEFSHFLGSGLSLVAAFWLLRATTRRFGHKLSLDFLAFLSACITFSFCAYYEILELWDERFWGDFQRLWSPQDSANDLQCDLAGIVVAALITALVFKVRGQRSEVRDQKSEVRSQRSEVRSQTADL